MGVSMDELINSCQDKNIIIIGAGGTLREYHDKLVSFIQSTNAKTIGINNMVSVIVPDYHVWTNTKRWISYHSCINERSKLIIGSKLASKMNTNKKLKKIKPKSKYVLMKYEDSVDQKLSYKKGKIRGYFRTAGCLSIMIAYLMSAKNIYVAGMDGFTFHDKKELKSGKHQHVYESGFSDTATWKECVKKDVIVNKVLKGLKGYGINFSIITPTKFGEFYDGHILNNK